MQTYTALYANGTTGLNGLLTVHDDIDPNANYTSNIGSAAKKFLTAHIAELRAELMTIEERRVTTGGRFNVGIGNVLASDLSAGATSISVEYNNLNNGDIIHLEKVGQVEFISVDSAASGTGPYSYDITRNLDGTGANAWTAGDGIFNTGQSGSGFIDMYATTSLLTGVTTAGPTTAYMERTGATYNNIDIRAISGNMKGWYGYGSDIFGFGAGDEDAEYFTIDTSNGIRFIDGADSDTVLASFSGQVFQLGTGAQIVKFDNSGASLAATIKAETFDLNAGSGDIRLDSTAKLFSINSSTFGATGIQFDYNSGTPRAFIGTNAGNFFKWDGTDIFIEGVGTSIDNSGFSLGGGILTGDGSGVAVEGIMTVGSKVFIGDNVSSKDGIGSGRLLIGDWDGSGTSPQLRLRGTSGGAQIFATDTGLQGRDSSSNVVFLLDISGGDGHQIGGAYFDDVDLWLGNSSKGSATLLLDGTNGFIDTGSVGQLFVSGETKADNTSNDTAPTTLRTSEWQTTVSSQSDGAFDNEQVKVRASFIKRFGADMITIRGYARQVGTGPAPPGGTVIERTSLIWVDCTPIDTQDGSLLTGSRVQNSVEISSTNQIHFELTLDISGFTNDELHIIRIRTEAVVDITSGDGSTYGTKTYLRFDVSGQTSSS